MPRIKIKTSFFLTLFFLGVIEASQAMKPPLTTEEAAKKTTPQRKAYYQTAFAEAVKELQPLDYRGYQRVQPLLEAAMSQLVRGADAALSQNIHTLLDPVYGGWGRLLVDRLWQVVEELLGEDFTKPASYSPQKRGDIVIQFAMAVTLKDAVQKKTLFETQQWRGWPSWLKRAQSDVQNIGLFQKVQFVELLDLTLKLHQIEFPLIEARNQNVVGVLEQVSGQINDMILCGGGCSSGSFWRLLYVLAGAFQNALNQLEEEIQLSHSLVASLVLEETPTQKESLLGPHILQSSPSDAPSQSFENLGLRGGGVEIPQKEEPQQSLKREEQKNQAEDQTNQNSLLSPPSRLSAPPYAPSPGSCPKWDVNNRPLSIKRLGEWQVRKEAYEAYQKWLKEGK